MSAPEETMKTVLTIYGDSGKRTTEAANALAKTGIPFRVCLTHDHPGTPILSLPFGDICGVDSIRAFADRAVAQGDALAQVVR
jgi:hypothetical protein